MTNQEKGEYHLNCIEYECTLKNSRGDLFTRYLGALDDADLVEFVEDIARRRGGFPILCTWIETGYKAFRGGERTHIRKKFGLK